MIPPHERKTARLGARFGSMIIGWLLVVVTLFSCGDLRAQGQPNVIFIAVDDLNNWTGFSGHPDAITPNMDALANEGVRFSRAYCAYPAPASP